MPSDGPDLSPNAFERLRGLGRTFPARSNQTRRARPRPADGHRAAAGRGHRHGAVTALARFGRSAPGVARGGDVERRATDDSVLGDAVQVVYAESDRAAKGSGAG